MKSKNKTITCSCAEYNMDLALEQARLALAAGEFPVGCVIVHGDEVVATGERANSSYANELDHAEIVAMRSLLAVETKIPRGELVLYSTMEPCLMCYSTMLVNGIRHIVYAYEDAMGGGTNLPLAALSPLYRDLQIELVTGVRRNESLALFQEFFKNSSGYLQDSYLCRYTLAQKLGDSDNENVR